MRQDADSINDIRFATFTESAYVPDYYQSFTKVNNRIIFDHNNDIADLRQWLKEGNSSQLGFAWTDYASPTWETQAVAYYPWLIRQDTWFTSRYLTLAHDSIAGAKPLLHPLSDKPFPFVNMEWGQLHFIHGDSLDANTDGLGIVATIQAIDTVRCSLVMEVRDRETDSLLLWQGISESSGTLTPGNHLLVNAIRFDKKKFPIHGTVIKTYIWDQNHGTMIVNKMDYYPTVFDTKLTGLYRPL